MTEPLDLVVGRRLAARILPSVPGLVPGDGLRLPRSCGRGHGAEKEARDAIANVTVSPGKLRFPTRGDLRDPPAHRGLRPAGVYNAYPLPVRFPARRAGCARNLPPDRRSGGGVTWRAASGALPP